MRGCEAGCKAIILLPALLAAGCSRHEAAVPSGNRLAVVDGRGNLLTMDRGGRHTVTVAGGAGRDHAYRQPAWSPDGDSLAWVAMTRERDRVRCELVMAHADGRDVRRAPTEQPAVYVSWRPDGGAVAYLSSTVTPRTADTPPFATMGLFLCPADGGADPAMLAVGKPFYFAWSPDGRQVLMHANQRQLGILDVASAHEQATQGEPAPFAAPSWSAESGRLVYPVRRADGDHLVLRTPGTTDDQSERDLLDYEGHISFVVAPHQPKVALTLSPPTAGATSFGTLYVVDYAGDTPVLASVHDGPVMACWWSPDGTRLLYLVADVTGSARPIPTQAAPRQFWATWHVWDGKDSVTLARFAPSQTFLGEYLPFADQYAQSMTLWSPDSRSFCYAGHGEERHDGIYVQDVDAASPPKRIADGVYAAWSPH
jgi:Tol biopolymer transport system component